MGKFQDLTVIVPVLNEGRSILETVTEIRNVLTKNEINGQILVVDDGSTDDTLKYIKESGAEFIRHPKNQGYGAALSSGIMAAKHEWVVITDADLTYPFESLPVLLEKTPDFDMVVGARQGRFYHGSLLKRLLRMIFKFLVEFVTAYPIPDINSGFRVFRKTDAKEFLPVVSKGFSFTTTITLLFLLARKQIEYVPVAYHQRAGKSHVKLMRDGVRALQFIFEAVLAYNPIKAFLLLIPPYVLGSLAILGVTEFCLYDWRLPLLLVFTGVAMILSLGFLAISFRLVLNLKK
jgi:glycosyltransferase involved in cell wall biosynthesis